MSVALALLAPASLRGQAVWPQWYLDLGAEKDVPTETLTLDTDGDGIPDWWERRVYSDPLVPDAHLDRDNDGLSDLEEFWFGSDPRTYSTMGDGWSDKEKRDAGLDAADRVTPAVTHAQWLAWLGWDAAQWRDATALTDGFISAYRNALPGAPPYSTGEGAMDFFVELRTDRHAWLTVTDALTTNAFPVPAGTPRVRIRAALGGPVTVTLDPLPGPLAGLPDATNGLWLCEMRVAPAASNTVVFVDGETPDPESLPVGFDSVDGLMLLAAPPADTIHSLGPPPGLRGGGGPLPSFTGDPLRVGIRMLGDHNGYCFDCSGVMCEWPTIGMLGMDPLSLVCSGLNVNTPFLTRQEAQRLWLDNQPSATTEVRLPVMFKTNSFIYGTVIFFVRPCGAPTGVEGVETHPEYGHAPSHINPMCCTANGCSCVRGQLWRIGFDHDKVNTCFSDRHPEESEEDKKYQHCIGIVYSGKTTNLLDFVSYWEPAYTNLFKWEVNGIQQDSHTLDIGDKPEDLKPTIFWIKMLEKGTEVVWDRLVLVVNSPNTKSEFDKWYRLYSANKAWLAELPAAYSALAEPYESWFYTGVIIRDPEPSKTNLWKEPDEPGKYMHHTAKYQMRSQRTPRGHGHQTCYDDDGKIILTGVSAGTADYGATDLGFWVLIHLEEDVLPFIRALQLDGNPCYQNGKALDHALIHEGENIGCYIQCRPAIPNNKPFLQPGQVP